MAAAVESLKQARRNVEDDTWTPPAILTVAQWVDTWQERRKADVALGALRSTSYNSDASALARLPDSFTSRKLRQVGTNIVRGVAVDLIESGLKPQTVLNTIKALRKVMRAAVDDGIIATDPTVGVKVAARAADSDFDDLATWTAEEVADLLPRLDDRDRHLLTVALLTGMRRSELSGLRWRNVDLDAGVVRVRDPVVMDGNRAVLRVGVVKSKASRRTIALPDAAIQALKERRARQAVDKLAAGPLWVDNNGGQVFTWEDGRQINPDWITKRVQALAKRHGIQPIGAHGLRHTFATISLANGVSLVTVSEALGHSDVGVTANTYSHVTESIAREAAETVNAAIFGT